METAGFDLWRRWLASRDGDAFARLVRPELPHALGAARRIGLQVADAEDVVQDCLTELSRERSDRPIRIGLRPWLLRAAGLKARMAIRSTRRRRRRERRREDRPGSAGIGVLDLREDVEKVLGELTGEDREAVYLRYLHDLDYSDVARVLGTSSGAARVRVHRAIAKLREKFGAGAGAVVAALPLPAPASEAGLISAALSAGAPSVAATIGGAIAMKIGMKTALVALLLAAAGIFLGGVLATLDAPAETPADRTAEPPAPLDGELERTVAELRAEVAGLEAELRKSSGGGATGASTAVRVRERSADPGRAELRLRVTDEEERPLPDREFSLQPGSGPAVRMMTDGEGIASATDLEGGRYQVVMRLDTGTRTVYAKAKTGWRTDVHFRVPSLAAGYEGVVRWWEGHPAARVGVFLIATRGAYHDYFHTTTGSDGRFRLEGLPPGTWKVTVSGGPMKWPWQPTSTVTLPEEGVVTGEIVVGVPSVHGVVRSAATGDALAGVRVSAYSRGGTGRHAETDAEGAWSIPDLEPGTHKLGFSVNGRVPRSVNDHVSERGVPRRVDVELDAAAVADIVFLGPDGEPMTGNVHLTLVRLGTSLSWGSSGPASADGRIRLTKLPAGEYEITGTLDEMEAPPVRARLVAGQENRVVLRLTGK